MGLLDRMTGRQIRLANVKLPGGSAVEVKGEASYQDALSTICGGKCEQGYSLPVEAQVVPEPRNPYDPNAVKVIVGGHLVGYISRPNALAYRQVMQCLHRSGRSGVCKATIVGGWLREHGDEGNFGIWLDLAKPDELQEHLDRTDA